MNSDLSVGVVQQSAWNDKRRSLDESERGLRELARRGAQLVLLQELHATTYFCQTEDTSVFDLAESLDGPTVSRLIALARELDLVIVGSIFERRAAGLYHNTAVVLDRERGLVGTYRKMHIPDDPGFYEKFYFTPGDSGHGNGRGFTPVDTSLGRLGVLVCWDQWYPEAARLMALAGADLLLYPTAIGWDPNDDAAEQQRQFDAWQLIQRSHAVANGLPVVVANRTGHETDPSGHSDGINFWGGSFIVGPQGELLTQAGRNTEHLIANIPARRSETVRRIWPYLRDRRIDAYQDLTERYLDHR
ncbi:carbon-nitrogen hydrolase [Kushneria phosphatilytica]|uniref:Carbon-nitrogen hydrolase n=1 Tax=Kushneria phosphatilytica TaxID=657387 RepID=A0A1S1P2S3_9GAMM|nr:carbon-nitrogen hydrolase [Kushneria phosphatilytica]OHV13080.1 acyltransferase [Kushneria phosphatilytica]QEL10950.1 carbon-nitrogen hydrolase [Kushneria phosphatilytica]